MNTTVTGSPACALRTFAPYRMALVDALAALLVELGDAHNPIEVLVSSLVDATRQTILNGAIRSFANAG